MSPYLSSHPLLLAAAAALALGCSTSSPATAPEADAGHPEAGDGSVAATPEAGGDTPEAGPSDGGPPSDGAPSTCPATYADVPQFMPCSGDVSCSYFDHFDCVCTQGADYPREWQCISYNCICSDGDAGCVNEACTTDTDCPSGQHCSQALGSAGKVCSVGCEGDAGQGGSKASCPVGAMCETIAP
jgi:hypothetical protein